MRASQTVLPFKLTASDESLTAHAGLVLFDEYLGAMGIAGLINHELPGAGSAAGYDPSAHVAPLVLMLLVAGGRWRTYAFYAVTTDCVVLSAWMICRAATPVAIGYDAWAQTRAEGWRGCNV